MVLVSEPSVPHSLKALILCPFSSLLEMHMATEGVVLIALTLDQAQYLLSRFPVSP